MMKKAKNIEPQVFTFDVHFVLQVIAKNEKEAQEICEMQGGYAVSRQQTLRSVADNPLTEAAAQA